MALGLGYKVYGVLRKANTAYYLVAVRVHARGGACFLTNFLDKFFNKLNQNFFKFLIDILKFITVADTVICTLYIARILM